MRLGRLASQDMNSFLIHGKSFCRRERLNGARVEATFRHQMSGRERWDLPIECQMKRHPVPIPILSSQFVGE